MAIFKANLKSKKLAGANELLENLEEKSKTFELHKQRATKHFKNKKSLLEKSFELAESIKDLQVQRQSVFKDEISKNPLGKMTRTWISSHFS